MGQMKTRAEQIEFLRLNGCRIAAHAWQGWQQKGRGMICVLADQHNELQRTVPYDYLPGTDAARLLSPWTGSKEQRMVADYDPAADVIVCFVAKGRQGRTEIDSYRIKPTPAPEEAAERE